MNSHTSLSLCRHTPTKAYLAYLRGVSRGKNVKKHGKTAYFHNPKFPLSEIQFRSKTNRGNFEKLLETDTAELKLTRNSNSDTDAEALLKQQRQPQRQIFRLEWHQNAINIKSTPTQSESSVQLSNPFNSINSKILLSSWVKQLQESCLHGFVIHVDILTRQNETNQSRSQIAQIGSRGHDSAMIATRVGWTLHDSNDMQWLHPQSEIPVNPVLNITWFMIFMLLPWFTHIHTMFNGAQRQPRCREVRLSHHWMANEQGEAVLNGRSSGGLQGLKVFCRTS